jgi:hypothetical protein
MSRRPFCVCSRSQNQNWKLRALHQRVAHTAEEKLRDSASAAPAYDDKVGPDVVSDLENRLRGGSVDECGSMIDAGFAEWHAPAVEQHLDRTPPCVVKSGRGLVGKIIWQVDGVDDGDSSTCLLREFSHPLDGRARAGGAICPDDDLPDGHFIPV